MCKKALRGAFACGGLVRFACCAARIPACGGGCLAVGFFSGGAFLPAERHQKPPGGARKGDRSPRAKVIQIRKTERELELKDDPVSFLIKKYQKRVDKSGKMCGRFRY